jgi:hypothetical protein
MSAYTRGAILAATIVLALSGCPSDSPESTPPEATTPAVEPPTGAEVTEPTEEELPPGPVLACREARTPQEEDQVCPWFDLCTVADAEGEVRATFHAQVAWWHPVAEDRLIVALRTCRDPETGQALGITPGDAPQELLEITVTGEGEPTWRLLGRAMRGDMTCTLADDGGRAACVAVHAQRSMLWGWLLDLRGEQTSVVHARVEREGTDVIPELALRFDEGGFQVQLANPQSEGELHWVPLLPPKP